MVEENTSQNETDEGDKRMIERTDQQWDVTLSGALGANRAVG